MPECGFAPVSKAAKVAAVGIDETHLIDGKVANLEVGDILATGVDLEGPEHAVLARDKVGALPCAVCDGAGIVVLELVGGLVDEHAVLVVFLDFAILAKYHVGIEAFLAGQLAGYGVSELAGKAAGTCLGIVLGTGDAPPLAIAAECHVGT